MSNKTDNFKTANGIGLYKIRYEMDLKGNAKSEGYTAGVIAYTSDEAVNTLVNFGKTQVKGFKGLKIDEVAFEGGCHAISDSVRDAILKTAKMQGIVVSKEKYEKAINKIEEAENKAEKEAAKKKSIIKDK